MWEDQKSIQNSMGPLNTCYLLILFAFNLINSDKKILSSPVKFKILWTLSNFFHIGNWGFVQELCNFLGTHFEIEWSHI